MSFCQRRTMTPKRLAANAANAKKSTGPKTGRGKFFTKINGLNGGRPPVPGTRSFLRRCFELAAQLWGPGDPELNLSRLARLRKQTPEAFAILMRRRPDRRQQILGNVE